MSGWLYVVAPLHNFIQLSLNSVSALVQTLLEIRITAFRWSTIPQKQFIVIIRPIEKQLETLFFVLYYLSKTLLNELNEKVKFVY